MKISVAGTGYVGLSLAVLLAQHNEVVALDILQNKVDLINQKKSPIEDSEIQNFLDNKELNLVATTSPDQAHKDVDFVIISTPTNYDDETHFFDTSSVEAVIEDVIRINPQATIIIKSTIPVGYTNRIKEKFDFDQIIFSPEFLREGQALYDNLYPSRIVIGADNEAAHNFADLLVEGAEKEDIEVLFTGATEAEAIKLFSNTYLAVRIAYFNELDTYAEIRDLDTEQIIRGVGLDPRIGAHYNNPSFGYGGYCLPKDTKQLLANFEGIPQEMFSAVVSSNDTRKQHIANMILAKIPETVGVHRLVMKQGSENFREAAVIGVMKLLKQAGVEVVVYEPNIKEDNFDGFPVLNDLQAFKSQSDLIVTNRNHKDLEDVADKIYTRDIFNDN